jgi:hypothetical protein
MSLTRSLDQSSLIIPPPFILPTYPLLSSPLQMRDNVTVFLFAPPPCVSKSVRGLRRFTTSFVLGK